MCPTGCLKLVDSHIYKYNIYAHELIALQYLLHKSMMGFPCCLHKSMMGFPCCLHKSLIGPNMSLYQSCISSKALYRACMSRSLDALVTLFIYTSHLPSTRECLI